MPPSRGAPNAERPGAEIVIVDTDRFYYFAGTFYVYYPYEDVFEVVDPPVGAIVRSIPVDAAIVEIDGVRHYGWDDALFRGLYVQSILHH